MQEIPTTWEAVGGNGGLRSAQGKNKRPYLKNTEEVGGIKENDGGGDSNYYILKEAELQTGTIK
jgi:hypothetical protein